MNILMVMWDSSGYPPDPRVTKEAKTLTAAGHKVALLCSNRKNQQPAYETVNGIHVYRVILPPEKLKGIDQKLVRLGISSHVHPFWATTMEQAAIDFKADILHCHDLRPIDSALAISRKHIRLGIIADLHEMYPEAIKYYYPSWKGQMICTLGQWINRERRALEYADAAITISQQAKTHYYQKRFGAFPHVIRNTVDLEEFDTLANCQLPAISLPDKPIIMYEGSYNRRRGIDVLARAFNRVRSETDCCLLLAGAIPEAKIRPLVDERFHNDIIFTGNLPPESIPPLLKRATVLAHPILNTSPQTDYCCPHKIFEYMAAGKPVVASNTRSFEEYIHSTGAGLLARAGDPRNMARAILQILQHPADYGSNGRYAVERHYNWSTDGKRLLRLYSTLDTGARREAQEATSV